MPIWFTLLLNTLRVVVVVVSDVAAVVVAAGFDYQLTCGTRLSRHVCVITQLMLHNIMPNVAHKSLDLRAHNCNKRKKKGSG